MKRKRPLNHNQNLRSLLITVAVLLLLSWVATTLVQRRFKSNVLGDSTTNPGTCRNNPVTPPSGYQWLADCGQVSCSNNTVCAENTTDPNVNPDTSGWCFGFTNGFRCLQLKFTGAFSNYHIQVTDVNKNKRLFSDGTYYYGPGYKLFINIKDGNLSGGAAGIYSHLEVIDGNSNRLQVTGGDTEHGVLYSLLTGYQVRIQVVPQVQGSGVITQLHFSDAHDYPLQVSGDSLVTSTPQIKLNLSR